MAKYLKNNSSNRNQFQQFINKASQTSVLASCYSVTEPTSAVKGFHYCTTTGTGMAFFFSLPLSLSLFAIATSSKFQLHADAHLNFACRVTVVSLRSLQDRSPLL